MVVRQLALRIAFLLFLFFTAFRAAAQPTLPGITATVEKGLVLLSWNCQYNGVKAISVLRAADSMSDFTVIGFVKKLDKGVQVFIDGHPAVGKNCYKLSIVFSSGLTWRSNHFCTFVNKAVLESSKKLPSNDSLQHLIVTEDVPKPPKVQPAPPPGKPAVIETESGNMKQKPPVEQPPAAPKSKITVSFNLDTTQIDGQAYLDETKKGLPPKKRITISFDDPDPNASTIIISRYIFTDTATGHIRMNLPDDVNTRHYSVKFYDSKKHLVTEIPKINAARIILDKRNFQRKGTYKFVLRKDFIEFETGYITISANP
jgi:hypothetical protein